MKKHPGTQTYDPVQIGTQCWMAQNLNVGTMVPGTQTQGPVNVEKCSGPTTMGVAWTSHPITTPPSENNASARHTLFDQALLEEDDNLRAFAFSVRCLKDG